MSDRDGRARGGKALGTMSLKKIRVTRDDMDSRTSNPMNRLVPYLDLFARLNDAELARLAVVSADVVAGLRTQVEQIERALRRYADLLPRLADEELMRLTGASKKTIRFWRLCQARPAAAPNRITKDMPVTNPVPSNPTPSSPSASPIAAKPLPSPPPSATPPSRRPLTTSRPPEGSAVARAIRSRQETAPHSVIDGSGEDTNPRAKRPTQPTPPPEHESVPRDVGTGNHPQLDIHGSPFPGYDYDPTEPVPEDLELDLPELGDL